MTNNNDNELLLKALEKTGVYWFIYDAATGTATLPQRTYSKFMCSQTYDNMPDPLADDLVFKEDIQAFRNMFSYAAQNGSAVCTVRSRDTGLRLRISLTYSDEEGTRAAGCIEPIPAQPALNGCADSYICIGKSTSLELAMEMMQKSYYRIACIELDTNSMTSIKIAYDEREEERDFREDYRRAITAFAFCYVLDEYRDEFLNVMHPQRLRELFDSGIEYISFIYRRYESGEPKWVRTELIPLSDYAQSKRIMWYVKNIREETALEEKLSSRLMRINTDMNLRLETILGGISGGFKISREDEKYSYLYLSNNLAGLFGYTNSEFMDLTDGGAKNAIYEEDMDSAYSDFKRQLEASGSYSVKYRVKCRDGSLKWVVDSGKRVMGENGEKLIYSLYNDVTEIEDRSIGYKKTLKMLGQMVQKLSSGIIAYSMPDRKMLVLNDEAKRIFGCPEADLETLDFNKMIIKKIVPEDIHLVSEAAKKIKNPGDGAEYEFRIIRNDMQFSVRIQSKLNEFEDGSRFILSSIEDVTNRSVLLDIIRDERKLYRDALVAGSLYAYSADLTEGIVKKDDVIKSGADLFKLFKNSDHVYFDDIIAKWMEREPRFIGSVKEKSIKRDLIIERFKNGEKNIEFEYYDQKEDKYIRITALLSEISRSGHIMAFVVGTDTTENRKFEEQTKQALHEAYEAAKRANAAKMDFLSRMSHDIRTPMNAIIGMTAIADAQIDNKDRVADCLRKITVSSKHLLSIINEILDMSKIESGRLDLNEKEFSLSGLVDNIISMIRPQVMAKKQTLSVNADSIIHERVIGDNVRIQQAFLNLLGNAVKYTPEGGQISMSITEKASHQPKAGYYEFVFEDSGIGMSKEFAEHIFEPFTRETDSRVSKIEGTGLGMAITNNIVRMMNGNIKVESAPGAGSKFIVTLPLKLQEADDITADDFRDLSVLIADSDRTVCINACRIMQDMGMKCEYVCDRAEAVEKVKELQNKGQHYFALILDGKALTSGDNIIGKIRQISGDSTAIIISDYDHSNIEPEARAAGADAVVGKPIFRSKLTYIFRELISGAESKRTGNETDYLKSISFPGKRILLAEDNDLNAKIMTEILDMMKVKTEWAANGQMAADMFGDADPGYYHLILMDIQMPIMNGNDSARAIRSLPRRDAKTIPIIAMTANAFADDIQAALDAGMNEHIAKPLNIKRFIKVLNRWLK